MTAASVEQTRQPRTGRGRDRLIAVAMKLFADRGFDGVTVRDIAKEAGVSIGLINHHFDSKEGLREAVDAHFLTRTSNAIERASREMATHDLDSIARYQSEWIRQHEEEWPSFAAYLRRAISENSPWGANLFRHYYQSISQMIARFDAEGRISDETDRLWLPLLYMFILIGPLMLDPYVQAILGRSTYEPEMWGRFQKAAQQLFWNGAGSQRDHPSD